MPCDKHDRTIAFTEADVLDAEGMNFQRLGHTVKWHLRKKGSRGKAPDSASGLRTENTRGVKCHDIETQGGSIRA